MNCRILNILCICLTTIISLGLSLAGSAKAENDGIHGQQDSVFLGAEGLPENYHYFVTVLGAETERGARLLFTCLRQTHPTIPAGLFHFDNVEMAGVQVPYVIANASYATFEEAQESLAYIRATIDYRKILSCIAPKGNLPIPAVQVTAINRVPTYAALVKRRNAIPMAHPPAWDVAKQLDRTPLANFDGIGKSAFVPGTATAQAVIYYRPITSVEEVQLKLNDLTAHNPGVHFVALRLGNFYYIAMAAMTNILTIDKAVLEARRRGLYEFAKIDKEMPATVTQSSEQNPLTVTTIVPYPSNGPPSFKRRRVSSVPIIIERPELAELLQDRLRPLPEK